LRAVVDHHVDRPGVEVRQRMELTGTNRSIGLIVLIANAHQGVAAREIRPAPFARTPCERLRFVTHCAIAEAISLRRTMLRAVRSVLVQRFFSPFAGLVAMAGCPNPIPSRTRSLNASAPMVLCLKTWESRSLPGLQKARRKPFFTIIVKSPWRPCRSPRAFCQAVGSRQ
jgi:hypothetical protein